METARPLTAKAKCCTEQNSTGTHRRPRIYRQPHCTRRRAFNCADRSATSRATSATICRRSTSSICSPTLATRSAVPGSDSIRCRRSLRRMTGVIGGWVRTNSPPGFCQCRCKSCAALTDSMDSRRRGRPGEEFLQFRCRLKLMLCHGHHRRGLEEDAAILVLPHQVSLIWLARQRDAPSIVGLDECGVQHLSNVSNVRPTDAPTQEYVLGHRKRCRRADSSVALRTYRATLSAKGANSDEGRNRRADVRSASR